MGKELELLNEEILEQHESFVRVRRWYGGWQNIHGGILIQGLTGKETRADNNVIRPTKTFIVYKDDK